MLFYPVSTPGTLEVYAPARPDASPTVTVYDANGGALVPALTAASRDAVETTVAGGVARGDTQIPITATTDIVAGRRYLVGDAATEAQEFVVVREVVTGAVLLTTPLLYPHAQGESFDGTRIYYAFTASIFTDVGEFRKAEFAWKVATVSQPALELEFSITRHALASRVQPVDLQVPDPQLLAKVGRHTDWAASREFALGELLSDIGTRWQPWCLRGTTKAFERAHTFRWLALLAEQTGDDAKADRWLKRYQHALDQVVTSPNVDIDQDNTIAVTEGGLMGGRIRRA